MVGMIDRSPSVLGSFIILEYYLISHPRLCFFSWKEAGSLGGTVLKGPGSLPLFSLVGVTLKLEFLVIREVNSTLKGAQPIIIKESGGPPHPPLRWARVTVEWTQPRTGLGGGS